MSPRAGIIVLGALSLGLVALSRPIAAGAVASDASRAAAAANGSAPGVQPTGHASVTAGGRNDDGPDCESRSGADGSCGNQGGGCGDDGRSGTCVGGAKSSATATPSPSPTPSPTRTSEKPAVTLEFVSATDDTVTWRVRVSEPANITIRDDNVDDCRGEDDGDCGSVSSRGAAHFHANRGARQSFLVTQHFTRSGEGAMVRHTIAWTNDDDGTATTVSASYQVSGAPTLGWPLLAVFLAIGVGGALLVRRRAAGW